MSELIPITIKQKLFEEGVLPFQQCHASTVIVLPNDNKLVAFFAGTKEGDPNTAIWLSRQNEGCWLSPRKIFDHERVAQWNPVLHYEDETIWLFYKCGSDVQTWVTKVSISYDLGDNWSEPVDVVEGSSTPRGPVKNKLLRLSNGHWIAPNSIENELYWDAKIDKSIDHGQSWREIAVPCDHSQVIKSVNNTSVWQGLSDGALWETEADTVFRWDGVIQPTLWESQPGFVHMLLRSTRGFIYRSDSKDWGETWCEVYPTELPNNNSGIDLVSFGEGHIALVYNPVFGNWGARFPISVTLSQDNGQSWSQLIDLETAAGEYSYPAIYFRDGCFHVTYTSNRETIVYESFNLQS
ncbi:MAG: exo-alpha-sialidase [Vibrio sp.]|uniref:sialidase family protein n=1 Tax=Vibrio sp. TaxID=678 RepID=UPI003A85ED1F